MLVPFKLPHSDLRVLGSRVIRLQGLRFWGLRGYCRPSGSRAAKKRVTVVVRRYVAEGVKGRKMYNERIQPVSGT